MSWTEPRVAMLKRMWGEGYSASDIASVLRDVSRNAVIGKVHRLGLSGRKIAHRTYSRGAERPRRRRGNPVIRQLWQAKLRQRSPSVPLIEPEPDVPPEDRVSLLDLRDDQCRFPCGDPQDADFGFCGKPVAKGLPYCPDCARKAYQPPQVSVMAVGLKAAKVSA
mgnify:CR=1 FL=1